VAIRTRPMPKIISAKFTIPLAVGSSRTKEKKIAKAKPRIRAEGTTVKTIPMNNIIDIDFWVTDKTSLKLNDRQELSLKA